MGVAGFVACLLLVVWTTVRRGPKEDESYLGWLALTMFVVALPMVIDRLREHYGRARTLPLLGLFLAVCLVGLVIARARKRRRDDSAA